MELDSRLQEGAAALGCTSGNLINCVFFPLINEIWAEVATSGVAEEITNFVNPRTICGSVAGGFTLTETYFRVNLATATDHPKALVVTHTPTADTVITALAGAISGSTLARSDSVTIAEISAGEW